MPDILGSITDNVAAINPVAAVASAGTQAGISYMNMRNQNERLDRQERMSWDMYNQNRADANSAHQREVADLKAAGLNPILSANKGAGMASGSPSAGSAGQMVAPDMLMMLQQLANINKTNAETKILGPKSTLYDKGTKGISTVLETVENAATRFGEWLGDTFRSDGYEQKDVPIPKTKTGEDYSRDYFRKKPLYNHN